MAINFAAASTAGLNNPGTEIITLVKNDSGVPINAPTYDEMIAYLRSGDVPCLFVTDEAGKTGDIYQLGGYSETKNKIRFICGTSIVEFDAGTDVPLVYDDSTPLTGTTSKLQPSQVAEAVLAGRPVVLTHTDSTYGPLKFTCFNIAMGPEIIASNAIIEIGGTWVAYGIFGDMATQKWSGKATPISAGQ